MKPINEEIAAQIDELQAKIDTLKADFDSRDPYRTTGHRISRFIRARPAVAGIIALCALAALVLGTIALIKKISRSLD